MEKNLVWWKEALIYQVYPLSFKDSNNDGIGDINGVIEKLDYLKDYGVDVIWLSPVYLSPMDDNGYDIADYLNVNPMFGTNKDLDNLISEVHKRGMKIIMDLVLNHTSDEHHWFKESKSSKDSPYRDYYIWNDEPTPRIKSIFSGPAWEYDETTKQYYFHLFSKKQPDLNWKNKELREEIYNIINTWLDKGIDGFRMDVIELIGKDVEKGMLADGPYLELFLSEINKRCFEGRDIMTVGEMGGISVKRAQELTSNKSLGMNMTFQFSHLGVDQELNSSKWNLKKYKPIELKRILSKNNEIFKDNGWNALFLSNHDQPRQVSRFGNDKKYRIKSSQMLFTMIYMQRGTPYVYQGEEIGMTGIKFKSINDYKDIETLNWYQEALKLGWKKQDVMESIYAKGRDNSRTPFQWDGSLNAGFSKHEPWLKVNPNYMKVNAQKDVSDPNGVYQYTKNLFKLRKKYKVFINGDFKPLFLKCENSFIYERNDETHNALVVTNMNDKRVVLDLSKYKDYECILSNDLIYLNTKTVLKPYAAAIFIRGKQK